MCCVAARWAHGAPGFGFIREPSVSKQTDKHQTRTSVLPLRIFVKIQANTHCEYMNERDGKSLYEDVRD